MRGPIGRSSGSPPGSLRTSMVCSRTSPNSRAAHASSKSSLTSYSCGRQLRLPGVGCSATGSPLAQGRHLLQTRRSASFHNTLEPISPFPLNQKDAPSADVADGPSRHRPAAYSAWLVSALVMVARIIPSQLNARASINLPVWVRKQRELKGRAPEYVPGGPLRPMTSPPHLSSLIMLASASCSSCTRSASLALRI